MAKYVCLRDDDTSFFTDPNDLIDGYGQFWGQIPITLATVPFSHGSQQRILDFDGNSKKFSMLREWEINATPEEMTNYHRILPIGLNEDLVTELKKQIINGKIEIAQHGVSHRYNEYGPETRISQITLPSIRDGMEYLNKVFSTTVKTFIPPSNTIDLACARYVNSLGMHLFVSGEIIYNSRVEKTIGYITDPKAVWDKLKYKGVGPIRRRSGLFVFSSFTYDTYKTQESLYNLVKNSLDSFGFAALGTHYMLLDKNGFHGENKEYRKQYQDLIAKIQEIKGVEFVTASKYFDLMLKEFYA